MDLGIEGRVAMVLGAAGGLGGAIAGRMAREGAHVAACDINQEALATQVETIASSGGEIAAFPFELGDFKAADGAVDAIESQFGTVDILVNVTGGPPPTTVSGLPTEDWSHYFKTMVMSVVHLTDRVVPHMSDGGWGRIITSTSSGVIAPISNLGLSNSLRSTLLGWSKTLAGEVAANGVTVNVVVPGRIATTRIHNLNQAKAEREGRSVDDVSNESTNSIPVGRYGTPEEYADVVTFLGSNRASFVNGSIVRVDGGMIANI